MGAIAGVIGSAISATGQSGQKGDMQQNNVSGTASVNNNGNNLPDIKEAKVEKAAEPIGETKEVEAPKTEGNGDEKIDWRKLSRLADELTAPQGSSAPITANNVSNTQSIANFR